MSGVSQNPGKSLLKAPRLLSDCVCLLQVELNIELKLTVKLQNRIMVLTTREASHIITLMSDIVASVVTD